MHLRRHQLQELVVLLRHDVHLDFTAALAALCTTQLHIYIRFSEYLKYPYKLWCLSQKWNPSGFVRECELFLNICIDELDAGYSLLLHKEALARGAFSESLSYLLSQQVQDELAQIFQWAQPTSLQVERKNYLDRRGICKDKSMSCARASRNSILQLYRTWRLQQLGTIKARKKVVKKMKHMNLQAVAVQRQPKAFPRARGRLHWQAKSRKRDQQKIVHAGDPAGLKAFRETHREELAAEAAALRAQAKILEQAEKVELPLTTDEWLQWMGKHNEFFHNVMAVASKERQKEISYRLQPFTGLGEVKRILPKAAALPSWAKKIKASRDGPFFLLRWQHWRQIVLAAGVGDDCFGALLTSTEINTIVEADFASIFKNCKPLVNLISALNPTVLDEEPKVFALEVSARLADAHVVEFTIMKAIEVENCVAKDDADIAHIDSDDNEIADSDSDGLCSVVSQEEEADEAHSPLLVVDLCAPHEKEDGRRCHRG